MLKFLNINVEEDSDTNDPVISHCGTSEHLSHLSNDSINFLTLLRKIITRSSVPELAQEGKKEKKAQAKVIFLLV